VAKAAEAKVPETGEEWAKQRDGWVKALKVHCLAGWDEAGHRPLSEAKYEALKKTETLGIAASQFQYKEDASKDNSTNQTLILTHRAGLNPQDLDLIVLNVLDEQGWQDFANTYAHKFPKLFPEGIKATPDDKSFEQEKKMFENFKWGMAYICPRGIGPTRSKGVSPLANNKQGQDALPTDKYHTQLLRRFHLIGQTLEGQQVWDVRCAIRALRSIEGLKDTKLWLQASRTQAANALMASLFEDKITRLDLHELPHSLMPATKTKDGHPISGKEPVYLNMLKYLDLPQAAAMAAERTRVVIYDNDKAAWGYPAQVSEKLDWSKEKTRGIQLRDVPKE